MNKTIQKKLHIFVTGNDKMLEKDPKMNFCVRLGTTFIKEFHQRKLKFDWTRLQSKY